MIGALGAAFLRAWSAPRASRFQAALGNCEHAQRRTLARIVQPAAATEYAQEFGLSPDDDIDAFRAKLPPVDYAILAPLIAGAVSTSFFALELAWRNSGKRSRWKVSAVHSGVVPSATGCTNRGRAKRAA